MCIVSKASEATTQGIDKAESQAPFESDGVLASFLTRSATGLLYKLSLEDLRHKVTTDQIPYRSLA
eukprot:scaffold363035_cov31-Prasinocladus_malaysianus.AAC.1